MIYIHFIRHWNGLAFAVPANLILTVLFLNFSSFILFFLFKLKYCNSLKTEHQEKQTQCASLQIHNQLFPSKSLITILHSSNVS
jgi:hypothetical protein